MNKKNPENAENSCTRNGDNMVKIPPSNSRILSKSHSAHDLDSPTCTSLPQCATDQSMLLDDCQTLQQTTPLEPSVNTLMRPDVTRSEIHLAFAEPCADCEHGGKNNNCEVCQCDCERNANYSARSRSTSLEAPGHSGAKIIAEQPEPRGSIFSLPRQKLMVLVVLCLLFLSCFVVFSCIAPFFPFEGQRKGLTQGQIGAIFGSFSATTFIFSPIASKLVCIFGTKAVLIVGALVAGIANILFGIYSTQIPQPKYPHTNQPTKKSITSPLTHSSILVYAPDGAPFLWLCLSTRILEAVGAAGYSTAGWTIAAHQFPQHAIVEMSVGLGFVIGPPLGGLLYELGGYVTPFLVLGAFLCVCSAFAACALPRMDDGADEEKSVSMFSMLRNWHIVLLGSVFLVSAIMFAFLDPTLEAHLRPFGLSPLLIGLCFLVIAVTYSMTAPLWGALIDKTGHNRIYMIIGGFCSALALMFLGPSPLLAGVEKTLPGILCSLGAFGLSQSIFVIPCFGVMIETAKIAGFPDGIGTTSCISGLVNAIWAAGAFIGPTLGSYAVELCGFAWSVTGFSAITAVVVIFLTAETIYMHVKMAQVHTKRKSTSDGQLLNEEQIIIRF